MRVTANADDALEALDDVLLDVFGRRSTIQKADLDPTDRGGFDEILRIFVRQLIAAVKGPEAAALQRVQQGLDVDWAKLSEEGREHVIRRAMAVVGGLQGSVTPKVRGVLEAVGRDVILGTKKFGRERYGIEITPTFHAVDKLVVKHAAESQALFIRNEYGRREVAYSAIARKVVSRGLEDGLDRYDIAKDLSAALVGTSAQRSDGYYRMLASVFATRARTYSTLDGFTEAGIEITLWSSVLDEETTDICRFMDGQQFSTSAALEKFHRVAASEDPEVVRDIQPFVSKGKDDDGEYLYVKSGEKRVVLTRIDESAVGKRDERGSFSRSMSAAALTNRGVCAPPAHPHCRSLLIPG